jgi:hypothetical protein
MILELQLHAVRPWIPVGERERKKERERENERQGERKGKRKGKRKEEKKRSDRPTRGLVIAQSEEIHYKYLLGMASTPSASVGTGRRESLVRGC